MGGILIKRQSIVFDIDGTLADITHRLHHIQKRPKDWPAFFDAMADDKPVEPLHDLLLTIAKSNAPLFQIVLCSGRSDDYREQTEAWLAAHGLKWSRLFMRKAGDYRADDIVKGELLQEMRRDGWNPVLVIDDRKRVVDMWRANGILCLQCAEGEF